MNLNNRKMQTKYKYQVKNIITGVDFSGQSCPKAKIWFGTLYMWNNTIKRFQGSLNEILPVFKLMHI